MIFNTSVINNVATLVSHICRDQDIIIKTMYHVMNVTSNEAECYDLDSVLSKRHTLALSNTRELNRELYTETSTFYTQL